jgi:hypothetical protein
VPQVVERDPGEAVSLGEVDPCSREGSRLARLAEPLVDDKISPGTQREHALALSRMVALEGTGHETGNGEITLAGPALGRAEVQLALNSSRPYLRLRAEHISAAQCAEE